MKKTIVCAAMVVALCSAGSQALARPCDDTYVRWSNEEDAQGVVYSGLTADRGSRCDQYNYSTRERALRSSAVIRPQSGGFFRRLVPFFRRMILPGRTDQSMSVSADQNQRRYSTVVAVDCSDPRNAQECGCVRDEAHPDCEDIVCGDPN